MIIVDSVEVQGKSFLGLKVEMDSLPPMIILKGEKGFVMCGYLNIDVAEKLGAAAAIVSGVSSFEDVLNAEIISATTKAKKLGLEPGKVVKTVIGVLILDWGKKS